MKKQLVTVVVGRKHISDMGKVRSKTKLKGCQTCVNHILNHFLAFGLVMWLLHIYLIFNQESQHFAMSHSNKWCSWSYNSFWMWLLISFHLLSKKETTRHNYLQNRWTEMWVTFNFSITFQTVERMVIQLGTLSVSPSRPFSRALGWEPCDNGVFFRVEWLWEKLPPLFRHFSLLFI